MRCIICGKEERESIEHIIPQALGNEKLITERVCEACNKRLGANIDYYLTDHPLVKLIRMNNGIVGKKNKIKFFDGVEKDIHSGIKYSMKDETPKILPRIISDKDGGIRVEAANFEEGLAYLKKVLKRKGYCKEDIESYCENAYCLASNHNAPEFRKDASINFALMDLAAVKIAYEYAHFIIGDEYLDDEIALLFKRELYKAAKLEKHSVVPDDGLAQYVIFPISGSGIDKLLEEQRRILSITTMNIQHTIFFIKQDNCLYCILNLFMTDVISFAVKISNDAKRYRIKMPMSMVFEDGNVETL